MKIEMKSGEFEVVEFYEPEDAIFQGNFDRHTTMFIQLSGGSMYGH